MLPIQRKRPTEGRKNALEGATTSFASSSRSRKRPDTASTVNSFASARGFSSDDAYSPPNMTTSLPRASIGGNSIDSSRSSNHYASTARRPSTSSNKNSFDDMLRSGNTWVMSQTADIAKDEAARRRLVASSPDPARSSSSSSSSSRGDGGRRLIVRRASELIDSEDDDTAEGHDAMIDKAAGGGGGGPGGQRRRVTNPVGAGPAQETINEDVSAEATPRLTSPSSPLHAQGKTSPYGAAPPPSSIPVERSPSTSTRGSSLARYATPPSGGASPVLAPATALPVHPHHRDRGQDMPTSPSTPERRRANGQGSAQQQSSSPDAPSNAAAAAAAAVAVSADAREQRQGLGLGVGPSQTLALPADQQNSTPRARSKTDASNASNATYMPFPTDSKRPLESISLAAEQQQLADMDKSGTTFFKERMKKTSGFLRRLRGGGGGGGIQTAADGTTSTPKLGDVGRSQTAKATMSAAKLVPPSTPKLNRKASQNSVASEGGASVRSAPGGSSRATDYADEVPVPVPSIPSKFKDQVPTPPLRTDSNPKKETKDTGSLTSRRVKSKQREADGQRAKQSDASRSVSAPQGGGGSNNEPGLPPLPSKESMSSSSSNGSSSATAARPVAPEHHRHVRKASSAHGGSAGSGSTEMRHALSAWASEMDQTLSTAAQDLDVKTKMQKPGLWGPTPQLPDFGHRNRSGSFMEEDEEANTDQRTAHSAPNTPLDLTPNNSAFVTPQGTLRANSNFLQRANELGLAPPVPGGKVSSKSRPSIIQSDPARSASSLFLRDAKPDSLEHNAERPSRYDRSGARSENASNMTSVSYETAIDRQSAFLIHANRREAAPDANDLDVSSSSSEGIDPETSIRLITPASTADGDPSVTLPPSTGELKATSDTADQSKSDYNSSDVASAGAGTDLAGRAKEAASQCWNEDESFKKREKIAEWLGGVGTLNHLARQFYFQNFDFSGLRLDTAFRRLCDKLFLRAETQQVDRILSTFSARYVECNPTSLFGSADVVHSVVFSLLLLNTDLHVADINDRMTRTQFVRNTLSALGESGYLPSSRSGGTHDDSQSSINVNMEPSSATQPLAVSSEASSAAAKSGATSPQDVNNKLQVGNVVNQPREKARSVAGSVGSAPGLTRSPSMNSSVSRNPPSSYSKSFEVELENVLKDIYAAVKADRIRLPLDDSLDLAPMQNQRRPAKPSAPGSERYSALKRGSIRGIQGLLGNSTAALRSDESLSPSSFGGRSLGDSWLFAPSTSTATSSGASTSHLTMPTLGFANTLSQSIIREANDEDGTRSLASGGDDITDEELALIGPPWAKEGTLTRKHYWEAPQKRAKDKNWVEVFVVAQKGTLSVFRFGDSASSTSSSQQARGGGPGRGTGAGAGGGGIGSGGGMGGGNWLSNAVPLGHIPLAHTLANSLPPPGYSRARPHVFALTLPGGDVYFFQTGHEELVQEWVSTCNYWAARQSREPFAGGVSNMEYGWNRVLPQEDDDGDLDEADEVLANVSEEAASPSPQPDGGLYSASTIGVSSANAKGSDSRSVRSGRSGRSLRSRAGSALFQNWTDASSIALRERSGSSSIFEGQGGSGTGAITNGGAGRTGSAGALKRVLSHTTTSSAQGSAPGSPYRGAASNVFADNRPIYVNEWRPPAAPMQPSTLSEEDQLEACLRHTSRMETELTQHNSLREPMLALKPPPKALVNWERKSAYLLGELTKFQVYVDSLQAAAHLRAEMRGKREVEKMIRDADDELAKVNEAEEGPPVRTVETAAPSH